MYPREYNSWGRTSLASESLIKPQDRRSLEAHASEFPTFSFDHQIGLLRLFVNFELSDVCSGVI